MMINQHHFLIMMFFFLGVIAQGTAYADEQPPGSLTGEEEQHLVKGLNIANEAAADLFTPLEDRLSLTITDLLSTYHDHVPTSQDEHLTKVAHLNSANPFIQTINYIDGNQRICFVSPLAPNRKVIGLKIGLSAPQAALDEALSSGKPVLSKPFVIIQGKMGYSMMIPHPKIGALEIVFSGDAVFGPNSPFRRHRETNLRINDGGQVVYTSPGFRAKSNLAMRANKMMMGHNFSVEVIASTLINEKVLLIGSERDYPPFAIVNENGDADGFSVDLFKAVAQVMGLNVRFRVGSWEEVRTALERGEIDALPLVSYSEEREKKFDFTTPHTTSDAVAFIRKGDEGMTAKEDLRDKTIIAMRADATHDYLVEQGITKNLIEVETIFEALRLLADGKGDLALLPRLTGLLAVKELRLSNIVTDGPRFNVYGRGYGFAVREGNADLQAKLNLGLSIVKANGQYDEIYDKWFDLIDPHGIPWKTIYKYFIIIGVGFSFVLVAALLWFWSLRREVKHRRLAETALEKTVQEREAQNLRLEEEIIRRQQIEEVLNQQRVFAEAILENMQDGIVACDGKGILALFNRASRVFHGIDAKSLPPEEWAQQYDLFRADGFTPMETEEIPLLRAFHGERVQNQEMVIAPKEGTRRVLVASGQAIMDGQGGKIGAVISMHDITERREAEDALQRAKEAAENANQAKSLFLANMSHELRTPLNAILGFSEMIHRNPDVPSSIQEQVGIINRSGEHLLSMINGVLDLSKIEASRVELAPEPFDLVKFLEDINRMFEVRAKNAGLHFEMVLGPQLAQYVKADTGKLRQILINLLGNAIKFTQQGGFVLRARTLSMADKPVMVSLQLEVEDSGSGIPAEQLQRVFQPFVQADQTRAGHKGTGLGLAITKSFAELMGGEIHVKSELGKGTLFCVDLPVVLAKANEVGDDKTIKPVVSGLEPGQPAWRILVVEDKLENRLLLRGVLAQAGITVREAENGEQAVTLFQQWRPHFIWMDMRMPVMDGYTATAKIRSLPGGDTVKIIAITASAFQEQHKTILEAGCDDVVLKPFKQNEIFAVLAQQLGIRYTYQDGMKEPADATPEVNPDAVAALPAEWRERLWDAALTLSKEEMADILISVREYDPTLADGLTEMVRHFQFDRVLALLDRTNRGEH